MELVQIALYYTVVAGWILLSNTLMILLVVRLGDSRRELLYMAGLVNIGSVLVTIWLTYCCSLAPALMAHSWIMMK